MDEDRDVLVSNHMVANGTEDVVLQNVDQTISNDLTEESDEVRELNVQTEEPEHVGNRDQDDSDSDSDNGTENASLISSPTVDERERLHDHGNSPKVTMNVGKDELEALVKNLFGNKLKPKADVDDHHELLSSAVAKLCVENMLLKKELDKRQVEKQTTPDRPREEKQELEERESSKPVVFKTYHLVKCSPDRHNYYEDVPKMFQGDLMSDHLRGQYGLPKNISKYLEENPHIIFAPVSVYSCACKGGRTYHGTVGYKDGKLVADSTPAEHEETAVTLGPRMQIILKAIISAHQDRFRGYPAKDIQMSFSPPYRLFFPHNKTLLDLAKSSNLDESDQECTKMLCDWFEKHCREDWTEAEELMSRNKINRKHYKKLFEPDELCLWTPRRDDPDVRAACKTQNYPWGNVLGNECDLDNYGWAFNGVFRKAMYKGPLNAPPIFGLDTKEVDITSLPLYPMRFAAPGTKEKLIARGHKFWHCRTRELICYRESGRTPTLGQAERRFMVDYDMFRRLYPSKAIFMSRVDDLGEEAMRKKEPPDDDFLAMLPPHMFAFDIEFKAWRLIRVDWTTDVTWNKDAFNRLVIDPETREMIQAAVTSHGQNVGPTADLIAGKGQGLLILLHGGPGTGKTLTAESIAEAQEKPLYRVTCGDIGIEPEDVELYLRSVLAIGQAWGLVLLDEADVFLEERTVPNQKQNAIVSVFLRMLEYYDGILILTTNRVATFDEAFKSRIHLAVRYPNLDEDQRVKIWYNFIDVLRHASFSSSQEQRERVDYDDIKLNVPQLARHDMNGRQIRNVITMARYLARYRKEMLVYRHVQDALAAVMKFDAYLLEVRGSDERWARDEKLR